jgi:hypothetical protein
MSLESASKTNHKRVSSYSKTPLGVGTSHGHLDTLDSPRPGLGGNHHLPPYSILCNSPPRLHPNGSFSRDSQGGVPKLSRVGVLELWELISPDSDIRLQWGLNQSYSSSQKLSNPMLHAIYRRREEVDSQLLVVESEIANLTPSPSFAHNLGYRCPNGSCKAIWTSTLQDLSNDTKKTPMRGVLALVIELWIFGSPKGLQLPTFGNVGFTLTLSPKWGCDNAALHHVNLGST